MYRQIILSKFSNPPPKLPSLTLFRSISPFHSLLSPLEITSPANATPRFTQSHCNFSSSIVKSPSKSTALDFGDQSPINRTSPVKITSPVEITCPIVITSPVPDTPRFTQSHYDFSSSIVKSPSQATTLGFDVSVASPRSKSSPLSSFSVNEAQKSPLQSAGLCFGVSTVSPRFTQSPCDISNVSIAKSPPQAAALDFGVSTASPYDSSCASIAKSPPQAAALDFGVSTASAYDSSCASIAKSPPQSAALDFGVSTVSSRDFSCASIAKSPLHAALCFGVSIASPRFTQSPCDISNALIAKSPPQAVALDFGVSTTSSRDFSCASIVKTPPQASALCFGVSTAFRHSTLSPLRSYVNGVQSVHLSALANNSALPSVSPIFISTRGYNGTPGFRGGKVIKPPESQQIKKVDFRCAVEQRQVSEESPEDAVIELTFLQLPAIDNSLVPYFRIHSLLAACVENGKLVHIVDNEIRQKSDWSVIREHTGKEITKELKAKGITVEDMKNYWYDNRPDYEKFWSERFLKHHKFSTSQCIENYESLIWKFACEYLKDNKFGKFLASKGFETGSYYNSNDYLAAIDEFFGVKCYTTFKKHGDHPAAKEIAVLVKKQEGMELKKKEGVQELRDHPLHDLVGQGKFLLPNI